MYRGKLRAFVTKLEEDPKRSWSAGTFEVHHHEHFDDRILSDVAENHSADILGSELDHVGLDTFADQIRDVLKDFQVGDTVEIVGDAYIEYYQCNAPCDPEEWDSACWLESVKVHKMTADQVKRFVGDTDHVDQEEQS